MEPGTQLNVTRGGAVRRARFMRAFSALFLTAMIIAVTAAVLTGYLQYAQTPEISESGGGALDLRASDFHSPVRVSGAWVYRHDDARGARGETVTLPLRDAAKAAEPGFYLKQILLPENIEDLIMIAESGGRFALSVDDTLITRDALTPGDKRIGRRSAIAALPPHDAEVSISIEADPVPYGKTMLGQVPLLGFRANLESYRMWSWVSAFLLLGVLMFLFASNALFVIMRPRHRLFAHIALFDAWIILRVALELSELRDLLSAFSGPIQFGDVSVLRLTLALHGFIVISGVILAGTMFNDSKCGRTWPVVRWAFVALAAAALFAPIAVIRHVAWAELILLPLPLTEVFIMMVRTLKRDASAFNVFQIAKTTLLTALIVIDAFQLGGLMEPTGLEPFAYAFFCMLHIFTRLYDNRLNKNRLGVLIRDLDAQVLERTRELMEANERLSELSVRDALTGAYSRLYLEEFAEREVARSLSAREELYLVMLDLDHFKRVNDQFGHDTGDEVLRYTARVIAENVPPDVTFARIGGEEFVILATGYRRMDMIKLVEKLRLAVENSKYPHGAPVTASFGLARLRPEMTLKDLYRAADACMYRAKDGGRNRVAADLS